MAIAYSVAVEGDMLVVKASGFDETLEQVQDYGLSVIEACQRHGSLRVLCDERELRYRLSTVDTYAVASFTAARASRVARVAIVCGPQDFADAQFWEDVAVNRGLSVRAFRELAAARAWLAE